MDRCGLHYTNGRLVVQTDRYLTFDLTGEIHISSGTTNRIQQETRKKISMVNTKYHGQRVCEM